MILGRILKDVPSFLDNVDLIAGTSTGGLMALMLAAGYAPEECENIYKYACPLIFSKDPWRVYNPLKACSLLALLGFTSTKVQILTQKLHPLWRVYNPLKACSLLALLSFTEPPAQGMWFTSFTELY